MSNVELENDRILGEKDESPSEPHTSQTTVVQHPTPNTFSNTPSSQSRRDFLRRASKQAVKEAVDIGSKVVPGGALVRQFVESADVPEPDDIEDDPLAIRPKPAPTLMKNPLNWFAAWRKGRQEGDE
jgi:hypothetical protein